MYSCVMTLIIIVTCYIDLHSLSLLFSLHCSIGHTCV